jgi:hypothetical protein
MCFSWITGTSSRLTHLLFRTHILFESEEKRLLNDDLMLANSKRSQDFKY